MVLEYAVLAECSPEIWVLSLVHVVALVFCQERQSGRVA